MLINEQIELNHNFRVNGSMLKMKQNVIFQMLLVGLYQS